MKSKRNQGFTIIEALLVILVAGLLVGGAYYVGKHNKTPKTTSINSSSTSGISSTTGGHTYTDTSAGYTLQLPSGWSYIKGQPEKNSNGIVVTDYQGNPIIAPDRITPDGEDKTSTNGIMEVGTDTSTLTPKAYFEQNGFGRANYTGQGNNNKINGYDAYEAIMTGQGGEVHVPVVASNGKIVQFFYYASASMNKNVDLCNQIIQTIKFN